MPDEETRATKKETEGKLSVGEIIKQRVLPMIDRYQQVLSNDKASLDPDYRLGQMSENDLSLHKNDLAILKVMLGEYCDHPNDFYVSYKKTDRQNDYRFTLSLRRLADFNNKLPDKEENAIRQLNFNLVIKRSGEIRDQLLEAESLRGKSPEAVLLKAEMKAFRMMSLKISTISLYLDEEVERKRVGFKSGICISCTEKGIESQGVLVSGDTDHYTRSLTEKLAMSEWQTLVNFVITKTHRL